MITLPKLRPGTRVELPFGQRPGRTVLGRVVRFDRRTGLYVIKVGGIRQAIRRDVAFEKLKVVTR